MMTTYLLDTNYLIYLLDENADKEKRKAVLQEFANLLSSTESKFVLTPLIRYEVLRGITFEENEKFHRLMQALAEFQTLDITNNVSDLAIELYRFDEYSARQAGQNKNLDKRKFDMFHYATAKVNQLPILSKDGDITQIDTLYERLQEQKPS